MIKALRRASVTLALTLGFASFAFAQFGAEPAKLDLVKVRDDIYVIHNDVVPGNITVLVTDHSAKRGGTRGAERWQIAEAIADGASGFVERETAGAARTAGETRHVGPFAGDGRPVNPSYPERTC